MSANTRSQTSLVTTTRNLLGSFAGNRIPNLQVGNLAAGEYTLQFEIVEPTIDGLGEAVYAYISWKVAGQPMQRIISVFSGTAIGGVAEAVDVSLLDQSGRVTTLAGFVTLVNGSALAVFALPQTFAGNEVLIFNSQPNVAYGLAGPVNGTDVLLNTLYTGPGGPGALATSFAQYKVTCTLSKGTRPNTMQPPVLQTIATQANGPGLQVFAIPRNAGIISVLITVTTGSIGPNAFLAANGMVRFVDPSGLVVGEFIPFNFPSWYPVPPSATQMQLINTNNVQVVDFSVQWGVDG